jgi:calcium-dependent protein kinase
MVDVHMKEESKDDVFAPIMKEFSTTDIRQVYKFVDVIGGGHFGTVRRVHPKSDPQVTYAVKSVLRADIAKDIKLLLEELFILRSIDHPNIVKFHQAFIDYRYVHIVMEYCTGGELFDRIVQAHKFTEKHACEIMEQMMGAVKHLHEHGIVHRDLKPENFLMADRSEGAEVKLIDFGLSKRFSESKEVTHMTTVVGTPYYVAPEVLKQDYDVRCDVWSLGVILFVFLCGYPPFEGDNNKEIFRNVLKQDLIFDPADWNTVSTEAKDLVSKMLQKDPSKRITMDECTSHPWFKLNHSHHTHEKEKQAVLRRIARFRQP